MRRLTSIRVFGKDGLKGWTGEAALTGCDLFAGPNGSGKTTRLLAVTAGLRGLSRVTGPTAGEYLGPTRPKASITLEFSDGQRLGRDLEVVQGTRAGEFNARAELLVGRHVSRWDLADFAASSDTARSELLRGLLGAGGQQWTGQRLCAWLLDRLGLEAGSPEQIAHPIDEMARGPSLQHTEPAPWLEACQAWAAEAFTAANGEQSQAGKTVEELQTQQRQRQQAQAAGSLSQARARLHAVDVELQGLAGQIATASGGAQRLASWQGRSQKLAEDVGRAEKAIGPARELSERAAADLRALRERIAGLQPAEEARARLEQAEAAAKAAAEQHAGSRQRLIEAREAYREQRGRAKTLEALAGQASAPCRHCGGEDPLGLAQRIEEAQGALKRLEMRGRLTAQVEERDSAASANATVAAGNARTEMAHVKGLHERAAADLVHAEERVTLAQAEHERATKAVDDAESELIAHRQEQPPAAPMDAAGLEARRLALEAEKKEIDARCLALAREEGGEEPVQIAIARREKAAARLEQVKALKSALKDLSAEVARGAYGPITGHANRLLEEAVVPLRVYIDSESDFGGHVEGHGRVHFASLSDGERALVGASLAYAFAVAAKSPCPMVILDRLEAIDSDRLGGFLVACQRAVSDGRLANFLGALRADAITQVHNIGGVKVHWLGGEA